MEEVKLTNLRLKRIVNRMESKREGPHGPGAWEEFASHAFDVQAVAVSALCLLDVSMSQPLFII